VRFLDFLEHDPDSSYPEPSRRHMLAVDEAERNFERLKASLEKLTVTATAGPSAPPRGLAAWMWSVALGAVLGALYALKRT
jgi:hypothetical protein